MEKIFNDSGSLKPLLRKSLGRLFFLKNKFLLATIFFVIWMVFFDPKDISSDLYKRAKYKSLQKSEQHLNQLITETRIELDLLKTNTLTIEKYAREKYMMKKDNEDLFILNYTSENK